MKMRRFVSLALAGFLSLGFGGAARAGHDVGGRPPGSFDYYVLALTWVPGFCAAHGSDQECSKGLGFALHGLWPQFENGSYPTSCSNAALPLAERARFAGVYPNPSMISHEWSKHGTCSGPPPAGYFAMSVADERRVTFPPALRSPRVMWAQDGRFVHQAVMAANPGLPGEGIKVEISRGMVTGVEICITKRGAFRSCNPG